MNAPTQRQRALVLSLLLSFAFASPILGQVGSPVWTNHFTSPGNNFDEAVAVAVDSNRNVFVTGRVSNGTIEWYTTVKYSSSGQPLWTNRFDRLGYGSATPVAITVDRNGNIDVTGYGGGTTGGSDIFTLQYSNAGPLIWGKGHSRVTSGSDYASAIATDASNNVFVAGYCTPLSGTLGYATLKYSSSGAQLWAAYYDGISGNGGVAKALATDPNGNAIVTGVSSGTGSLNDIVTIKYTATGQGVWTNRYNGPGNAYDEGRAVAVATNGDVFVAGYSDGGSANYDFVTLKYSSAGIPLWTNRYNGTGNGEDSAKAITIDGNNSVLVTGGSLGSGTTYDFLTIKYSFTGSALWTNRYNGPGNIGDTAYSIGLDRSNNVFVTGSSYGGTSNLFDFATIAYSSAGAPLWTNRFNRFLGPGSQDDGAKSVVVDVNGDVLVTGFSWNGTNHDFTTIKYAGVIPSLPPTPIPLSYQTSGSQLILNWTNPAFSLQFASAVGGIYTNIPSATSPFTNQLTGGQQYFRLKAN